MRIFHGIEELKGAVGTHLGYSDWRTINQEQIDAFADATGDHQWIHVDPARAAQGLFGSTIAHGYLTLSLVPSFLNQVYRIEDTTMAVNYGANRVRYPSPVPVGSRLRGGVELLALQQTTSGHRLTSRVTIDREGSDKPACVAEVLSLLVP
ncbi:Acyl dehydratase [Micromonospora pallida]|uniref:Acyl dehydratase n=1 Tax=Micromonospora pallida TaxID=145854 RepID=A0A1C6RSD8_9ACTN|nr:MaoC family dehydratase [Micromonospora pallida]SCL20126.1 Acyl dehydratase [Micromonospora pallida]